MSNALYDENEFEALLREENILNGAFECLRRIWATPEALSDRQLTSSEYRTRLLEYELANLYPQLYNELSAQMGAHPITQLEQGCGVIMDALSLREGFRLEQELAEENNWNVSLKWAPIERLPSETQFICRAWFDSHSPSAVSRPDYKYLGDKEVPQLPDSNPAYVWTRHPDQRLEESQKGNFSMEEVEEIYQGAKKLLEDIIAQSVHDTFLVTSDHGYVNHHGTNPYTMTDDEKDALSSKFSSRFTEIGNSIAYRTLEEANIIERTQDHYVVRGHYHWTKRGAQKRIMHGGLSLPECMTPLLKIDTNGGNQS